MRHFRTGRAQPPLVDSDTLHLWTCDEGAATDDLRDLVDGGVTLIQTGDPAVVTGPVCSARRFAGAASAIESTVTQGQDAADMTGEITLDVGFLLSSHANQQIVAYSAGGESLATNFLIRVYLTSTGEITFLWEYGAGTNVSISTGFVLQAGRRYVLSVVRESTGTGLQRLLMYIGGVLVYTSSAQHEAEADVSGNLQIWAVGSGGTADYFNGDFDFVRVSKRARTSAECAETAQRAVGAALGSVSRVEVENSAGAFVDLSDWLQSVEYSDSVDTRAASCSVRFDLVRGAASLAKWHDNVLNRHPQPSTIYLGPDSTNYADPDSVSCTEALEIGREIKIWAAKVPEQVAPESADYALVFWGVVETVEWGGKEAVISGRDLGSILDRGYYEDTDSSERASASLETVIAGILSTAATAGWIPSAPSLVTPISPGWTLNPYRQGKEPVLAAINKLADMIGWSCRYRWNESAETFSLMLTAPERAHPVECQALAVEQIAKIAKASVSLASIRNAVRVAFMSTSAVSSGSGYTAGGGGSDGANAASPAWIEVQADDAYQPFGSASLAFDSISKYGRQFCEIVQGAGEAIDSLTEARDLADTILCDLSRPTADFSLALNRAEPQIELGDMVQVPADDVHSTTALTLAVSRVRHSWTAQGSSTSLDLRGIPATMGAGHLAKEVRSIGARPPVLTRADALNELTPSARLARGALAFDRGEVPRSRSASTQNLDFESHTFPQEVVDGWTVTSGGWGSDVYVDTTSLRRGTRTLVIDDGAATIESELFPVEQGALRVGIEQMASSATTFYVYLKFYSTHDTVSWLSTNTLSIGALTSWATKTESVKVPTTARFAQIVIYGAAPSGGQIKIAGMTCGPETFWAKGYRASNLVLASKAVTAITFNGERDSWGVVSSSGTIEALEEGEYDIEARVEAYYSAGWYARLIIYNSGTAIDYGPLVASVNISGTHEMHLYRKVTAVLSAGDTVSMSVYNDAGASVVARLGESKTYLKCAKREERDR